MDLANFDKQELERIWGTYPASLLSDTNACEFHHAMGRGRKKWRKMHSSKLNAAPLSRKDHMRGDINSIDMRKKLLGMIWDKLKDEPLSDIDLAFMQKYSHLYC